MKPIIEFRDATLGYGRKVVLRAINLAVQPGEYFGMVGPNGAGKTTIIRAILGTLTPLAGEVNIRNAEGATPRLGYVPQRDKIDSVLPYSVEEVVMMGRYRQIGLLRRPGPADVEAVVGSLRHADIEDLRKRVFIDLSGGQKQRVLIARALAARPEILILDEPTNGMDLSSRASILALIHRLHEEERLTVIMVSHLLDDVANHVRRLAIVDRNFFQVGDVTDVLTETNLSRLYQMEVKVAELEGGKVILAGGRHGAS